MLLSDLETSLHRFSKLMVDPDDEDDVELDVASSENDDYQNIEEEVEMSGECEAKMSEVDERQGLRDTIVMMQDGYHRGTSRQCLESNPTMVREVPLKRPNLIRGQSPPHGKTHPEYKGPILSIDSVYFEKPQTLIERA